MDSLITAAGRALAAGDPLGALKRVALRDDPPALALRGIAMAQLGDFARAKVLLRAPRARLGAASRRARPMRRGRGRNRARRRAILAGLEGARRGARNARKAWRPANAAHARYLEVRRLLLIGRLADAERALVDLDPSPFPAALRTAHELMVAGIAVRRLHTRYARAALEARARQPCRGNSGADGRSRQRFLVLDTPAARLHCWRKGTPAPAGRRRGAARVERSSSTRAVMSCAAAARCLAREASGPVCARPRAW